MKPKRGFARQLRRSARSISIGAGAALLMTLFALITLASASPQTPSPSDKQAALQQALAAQATAAANSPHAPKHPGAPITSCPRPPLPTGISNEPVVEFHQHIVNWAVVAPISGRPFEYHIFAGADASNAQQGILIVMRFDQDPCAPGAKGTWSHRYDTPFQHGALRLTQLGGDRVSFTAETGSGGSFNYIGGQFAS